CSASSHNSTPASHTLSLHDALPISCGSNTTIRLGAWDDGIGNMISFPPRYRGGYPSGSLRLSDPQIPSHALAQSEEERNAQRSPLFGALGAHRRFASRQGGR